MPIGRVLLHVLALCGVALAIEGAAHGPVRHRLLAACAGLALVAPAVIAVLARRRRWSLRRLAFAAIPSACLLVGFELLLRVLGTEAIAAAVTLRADPRLGHRGVPGVGGMDAKGFRNHSVPAHADVVCIGDSNTFGFGLRAHEAWPSALGAIGQLTTYNMSHGGYGPLQYLALAEEATALSPRAIVVALYLGNDLLDAHHYAGLAAWAAFVDPDLRSSPPELQADGKKAPNLATALLEWSCQRSVLAGVARDAVAHHLRENRFLAATYGAEADAPAFTRGRIHTLFTPSYRLRAVDLDSPQVRDGLRITGECVTRLAALCAAQGIRPIVVLLPTKESCYYRLAAALAPEVASRLATLYECESTLRERLRAIGQQHGVTVLDATEKVAAALQEETPCFSSTADGHFNAAGSRLVAELVALALQ